MRYLLTLALLIGCGQPQSAECAKWVACSDALPGGIKGSQDASYGPSGSCWNGSADQASTCTAQCKAATASVATQVAECR